MRAVVRLFVVVIALTLPVGAAAEDGRSAFREVIQSQLDAFQRDDGQAAFRHASPMIKGLFRTPETFMKMVVQGYPEVYRPREVVFGPATVYRGEPSQIVHLVGANGRAVNAYYQMQQQPDGTWKINGVYLEEATTA